MKYVTQVQQRPGSPVGTLTWHVFLALVYTITLEIIEGNELLCEVKGG